MIEVMQKTRGIQAGTVVAWRRVAAFALVVAVILARPTSAFATNETEITGGFVPVALDSADDGAAEGTDGTESSTPDSGSSQPEASDSEGSGSGTGAEVASGQDAGSSASAKDSLDELALSSDASDSGKDSKSGNERPGSASNSGSADTETVGIRLDDGSVVTIGEGSDLVLVRTSGVTQTLDADREYELKEKDGGKVVIKSDDGASVSVDGGVVSVVEKNGDAVVVYDATKDAAGDAGAASSDGEAGAGDADDAKPTSAGGNAKAGSQGTTDGGRNDNVAVIAGCAAAAAVVAGVAIRKRAKK
ncbi:MAG: hypothetical protein J6S63_12465 [Atopobiaceae bacterium]|nr:hypothetical protein [Atopobiaceae bacterium]